MRTALVLPLRLSSSPCPHPAPLFGACIILTSYSVFSGFFTNYDLRDYKDIVFLFHFWILNVSSRFVLTWGISHLVSQDWFMQNVTTIIFIFNLVRRLSWCPSQRLYLFLFNEEPWECQLLSGVNEWLLEQHGHLFIIGSFILSIPWFPGWTISVRDMFQWPTELLAP